ncbi:MAG TPA: cupin domain-containing protein [Alphaproteobacteria bacterium]|jgi:gentisate 1,2-dioxygenase
MTTAPKDQTDLIEALDKMSLAALWVLAKRQASPQPYQAEPAIHWRWDDLTPLIERALSEVGMEDAERRVLMLSNPAFKPAVQTTRNLIAAVQILRPGDQAQPHRHSAAAIRMILEAEGGHTSVDGKNFQMGAGDLILTPAWTWHGHVNPTDKPVMWIDGLDSPFVRGALDAFFFEHHPPAGALDGPHVPADRLAWAESGLVAAGHSPDAAPFSPKIHYPWNATAAALDDMRPRADQSTLLRYVNPQNGGAVTPTLDCFMLRLRAGHETAPSRSTANAVCVVVEGEGQSTVGDKTFAWKKNDVFTVPHWTQATHRSAEKASHLFLMTDREIYRRLGLLRDEPQI